MKKSFPIALLFTMAFTMLVIPAISHADTPSRDFDIVGSWEGTLSIPGATLRVIFHITKAEDGSLSATMDSPDQGAFGIEMDEASFEDNTVRIGLQQIQGLFEGTPKEDDDTIEGTWTQMGQQLPLVLKRVEKAEDQ